MFKGLGEGVNLSGNYAMYEWNATRQRGQMSHGGDAMRGAKHGSRGQQTLPLVGASHGESV